MPALLLLWPHNPQCSQLRSHGQQSTANLDLGNGSSPNIVDWLPDTRVNQHVTSDLATLIGFEPYLSNDHLHVGDDKDISMFNIRHTMLHTPKHTFTLSNILHMPHITKPLFYVHKLYRDYSVNFEFHAFVFYIKDLTTKAILLSG